MSNPVLNLPKVTNFWAMIVPIAIIMVHLKSRSFWTNITFLVQCAVTVTKARRQGKRIEEEEIMGIFVPYFAGRCHHGMI